MKKKYILAFVFVLIVGIVGIVAVKSSGCNSAITFLENNLKEYASSSENVCTTDSDCGGIWADTCRSPVALSSKITESPNFSKIYKEKKSAIMAACQAEFSTRPACSPSPFKAGCTNGRCQDIWSLK